MFITETRAQRAPNHSVRSLLAWSRQQDYPKLLQHAQIIHDSPVFNNLAFV